jgi:hypothetical protein
VSARPAPDNLVVYVEEDQEAQGPHAPLQGQPRQAPQHGSRLVRILGMARLASLTVGGTIQPWRSLGLQANDTEVTLGDAFLSCAGAGVGILSWTIAVDASSKTAIGTYEIDGIPTVVSLPESGDTVHSGDTPIGDQRVVGVDHVVINTDDLDRTCNAIADALGLDVRRERDAGNGVEQRFFKLDNTIVEVVAGPHVQGSGAALWGLVISVDDLFDLADTLGPEVTSPPKRATQPGRYISTVRSAVGLGVPFAMMTPHVRGMATR